MSNLRDWIGREERTHDTVTLAPARALAALLDRDPDTFHSGDLLPLGWHWIYCNPTVRQSGLGADGHAARGDFLPPISLPRRMWAGGRLRFLQPLHIGDEITRTSTILDVEEKEGRSGALVLVTVEHRISIAAGVAIEEQQNLIYRDAGQPQSTTPPSQPWTRPAQSGNLNAGGPPAGAATVPNEPWTRPADSANLDAGGPPAASANSAASATPAASAAPDDDVLRQAEWTETFLPTSVALFRFSALTFNAHRIHYDAPYAKEVEGYRGLLVHAPLTALLLLDASVRNGPPNPALYTYRAMSPLFCDEPITFVGRAPDECSMDLHAVGADGKIAMQALAAS